MSILDKLLEKRKIKDTTELDPDERITYDKWHGILSEGEITVDKIKDFCENQIKLIESQWKDLNNLDKKNERLIILHTVYKTLLELIKAPKVERENLEKYLNSLIT